MTKILAKKVLPLFLILLVLGLATILFCLNDIKLRYYCSCLFLWVLSLSALLRLLGRRPKKISKTILVSLAFILTILVFNNVLFQHHKMWGNYDRFLRAPANVGWRQHIVMQHNANQRREPQRCKYLAFGSSAVYTIFEGNKIFQSRGGDVFWVPGFVPYEYGFFKKYIKWKQPEYVLFYISEFELTSKIREEAIRLDPDDWPYLTYLFSRAWQYSILDAIGKNTPVDNIAGLYMQRFFSQYKYSFVFRSLLDKLIGYNRVFGERDAVPGGKNAVLESTRLDMKSWEVKYIKLNLELFEHFVQFCLSSNIKVIILEGQYLPSFYTDNNLMMHSIVLSGLKDIARKYSNVIFIPRTEIYEFSNNDYDDNNAIHVKREKANLYIERLFLYLEAGDSHF